jgi:hypothetical protein
MDWKRGKKLAIQISAPRTFMMLSAACAKDKDQKDKKKGLHSGNLASKDVLQGY